MPQVYTRQSAFSNGDVIDAPLFNAEFDQIEQTFSSVVGHLHDGTVGGGAIIDYSSLSSTPVLDAANFTYDSRVMSGVLSGLEGNFDVSTGHKHDGTAGEGAAISYVDILGTPVLDSVNFTHDSRSMVNVLTDLEARTPEPFRTVFPQTGGGVLTGGGQINQIRDSSTYTMPDATLALANTLLIVELPDLYNNETPSVVTAGSDIFRNETGTDTIVNFIGSTRLELTSDGAGEWVIYEVGSNGADGDNGIDGTDALSIFPTTPTNTTPGSGITGVSLTPTLTSSAVANIDIHLSSQWQIATDVNFSTIVHDVISNDLESHVVTTVLSSEVLHYWRVRYIGVNGASLFSEGTSFTTAVSFSSLFATTLYTGNGAAQDIVSGLDFASNDGLVWGKVRSNIVSHALSDTLRGVGKTLRSDSTSGELSIASDLTSFNSDGFSIGSNGAYNFNGQDIVAWQFIKKQGFFDIVQYTGDGVAGRTVALDLDDGNAEFGMSIIKRLNASTNWAVQHRSLGGTEVIHLNLTNAATSTNNFFNSTDATNTALTLGINGNVNLAGDTFISYNFAHNPTKGIFCGSYTGTASNNVITTGFPVGWLLIKATSFSQNWILVDIKRNSMDNGLAPNLNSGENSGYGISSTSDGFLLSSSSGNTNSATFIFVAIADPAQF
jgi:hypothetical protein